LQVVPIAATNPLPKAEQWLTEIVKSTSPAPRRAPAFSMQNRSKSLAAEAFDSSIKDLISSATSQSPAPASYHSTNPFGSPSSKPIQQSFQVQL
jgi:hypothetical protein